MTGPFKEHGAVLIANGYQIVPISVGDKRPVLKDWPNLKLTNGAFVEMANRRSRDGVGILTKYTPAVDIDILDEALATSMGSFVERLLGRAPMRIGKAPKRLYIFKTSEPFDKITSAWFIDPKNPTKSDGKALKQRVEILGDGQQFVAFHTHPDTGKPYDWPGFESDPLSINHDDLIELTHDQAVQICAEFECLATRLGWKKAGDGNDGAPTGDVEILYEAPPEEDEDEVARVRSALEAISADCDRDTYLRILAALKWTEWECAEELARTWAESAPEAFVEKHFNNDWRTLKADRGNRKTSTIASIYGYAKAAGWDSSRPAPELDPAQVKADQDAFVAKAALLAEGDTEGILTLLKELRASDVAPIAHTFIFKAIVKSTKMPLADVKKAYAATRDDADGMSTHATYANKLAEEIESETGVAGVALEGKIWTFSPGKMIWQGRTPDQMTMSVIKHFDGAENCERRNDYVAIAKVLHDKLSRHNEEFFNEAPIGMACESRFYSIKDNAINRESISAEHRQRVLFPVKPKVGEMPLFERFMDETFKGDVDSRQRDFIQEMIGATLLGFFYRYERVVLFKGPGRAGKGTIMKIIHALFPRDAIAAIPPTKWTQEYYLAQLAGRRLNLVGEIEEEGAIDGAVLKTVTGRDPLTGRMPAQMPFEFTNLATHIFNGNYFPPTRDQSDAFFSRWVLIEFRNSMIGHEEDIDNDLADKIVEQELSAIAAWAIKGAQRLMERGRIELPAEHGRLMDMWRKRSNSVIEFVTDRDAARLGSTDNHRVRRSEFYVNYMQWCRESGRKALGKQKVYELLETPPFHALGIKLTVSKGIDFVRGVMLPQSAFFTEDEGGDLTYDRDDEI